MQNMEYTFLMRSLAAIVFVFLCIPSTLFAAGFAKQSLFLSKTPVTEGDVVQVHTVVANDAATKFDGEVVFTAKLGDTSKKIGSIAVTIAPGGANAVSVSWEPSAGTYTVMAELTQKDGTVVEGQSANFTINEKPKPAYTSMSEDVDSSAGVQHTIASISPDAARLSAPLFSTIDSLRSGAVDKIDQGLAWSKKAAGKNPGTVKGVTTRDDGTPRNPIEMASHILATVIFYVLSALRWMFAHSGVFYPALAIAFLFGLWKIFRQIRRPS